MIRPQTVLALGVLLAVSAAADVSLAATPDSDFDRQAAASSLSSVDLNKCKAPNAKRGEGHVMVTFTPAGAATRATIDRGPMIGTPVQKCIEAQFKRAKVPAFKGDTVQVGKTFHFE